jgi:hypothetical protein
LKGGESMNARLIVLVSVLGAIAALLGSWPTYG